MTRPALQWLLRPGALLVAAVAAIGTAAAQDDRADAPSDAVIFCHDSARGIVQRKLRGNCDGEIVTPERADEIQAEAAERRRQLLARPQTPAIPGRKLRSIGSGFFVTTSGTLLTNNHVVDGCAALSVETPDGRKAQAQLLDARPADDLALLSAPLAANAVATFRVGPPLSAGAPVTVIGYPDQGLAPIKPLLTQGELGGQTMLGGGRPHFEIRADVRHGNSGGPVTDTHALVIGVVYAKVNSVAVFQATGQKVRFIGAVIDNEAVFAFLDHNNVTYATAAGASLLEQAALESRLRDMVARIGCWA